MHEQGRVTPSCNLTFLNCSSWIHFESPSTFISRITNSGCVDTPPPPNKKNLRLCSDGPLEAFWKLKPNRFIFHDHTWFGLVPYFMRSWFTAWQSEIKWRDLPESLLCYYLSSIVLVSQYMYMTSEKYFWGLLPITKWGLLISLWQLSR